MRTATLLLATVLGAGCAGARSAVPRTVADDPALPSAVIDGVRLHVETFGDPSLPTVVVVHGGPGNDFRYLLPLAALADRYRVVFYDQRGSGLSERVPDERLTVEGLYAELDGVVDLYGGGRPVALVGHSWGAMLASGYAGRHPEKLSHLVLAEPGPLTEEDAARFVAATGGLRPPMTAEVIWLGARTWLESLGVGGPDADARGDYLQGTLVSSRFEGHPAAGYYCNRDLSTASLPGWRFGARLAAAVLREGQMDGPAPRLDFVRGVERYRGPVLFLAGSCNAVLGPEQQRRHMRHFPGAGLVVIEGAGHTMFGEKPEESLRVLRAFLEAGSDSRPPPPVRSGS